MRPKAGSSSLPLAYLTLVAALVAALIAALLPLRALAHGLAQGASSLPAVSIENVRITEGAGDLTVRFPVTLDRASSTRVTVDYETRDGSARSGTDYAAARGTLVFEPGQNERTIDVLVRGDALFEANESFTVQLSNASGAHIAKHVGVGHILNDDVRNALTIGPSLQDVLEGDGPLAGNATGATVASVSFTVTLSSPSERVVTVDFETVDGTARAGEDFVPQRGSLVFAAGEQTRTITVVVIGDVFHEEDETFTVTLSNPANATLAGARAGARILNDDPERFTLDVALSGTGAGAVTSTPAGIDCGATCSAAYVAGATVTLSATPEASSTFTGWSGACTGTGPCIVSMTSAKSVSATFALRSHTLTVISTGGGTVTSSPAGVLCGATCATSFTHGSVVTLTATPETGATFTGWSGACTGTGTCTVTMDAARQVTASFTFPVSVSVTGTGTGSVTGSPAGITCQPSCTASFTAGTLVTLTATPDSTAVFTGWSGACTGTGSCVVLVDAATSVTATFTRNTRILTVTLAGSGAGIVTSSPSGIHCGATCTTEYDAGTLVTLTATPETTSTFTGWSGACTGLGSCTVLLSEARSVTATFTLRSYSLTVANGGGGLVTSSPAGILCGATCSAGFTHGTVVTLTATPDAGATFTGWSGACTGTGSCTITMDGDKTVAAAFTLPLTVGLTGTGSGTVTGSPAGISCPPSCTAAFAAGSVVTLTATPDASSTFAGWSGACTGTGPCTLLLDAAKSVTATFTRTVLPTLSVSDCHVTEGTGVTTLATCTVVLSAASADTVLVDYTTVDGSATAPADYTATSGSLTFLPGETTRTFTVRVNGDSIPEPDEFYNVRILNPVNAVLDRSLGLAKILNDDLPTLSINNPVATEGDFGTTNAIFTVTLSAPFHLPVTVSYATSDSSAVAGVDYVATSGSLLFNPGETTKTIAIQVIGDTLDEDTEFFRVTLSGATNAGIADAVGQASIADNDPQPTVSLGDVVVTEGNTGTLTVTITATLSQVSGRQVTLNYTTANGSAVAGSDYNAKTGTVFIARGSLSTTITVQVIGDTIPEPAESFFVNLTGAANATIADGQAEVKIMDNDAPAPPPVTPVTISINDVHTVEGNSGQTALVFTVTLSAPSTAEVRVDYGTTSDPNDAAPATAGVDYMPGSGTLVFAPGVTAQHITIMLNGDTIPEPNELFHVKLQNPINATIADGLGTGAIDNDD